MDNDKNTPAKKDFDFEEWASLARDDPAGFERRRREVVQAVIDSAPAHLHQRLEGLQFRLDLERSRSSTPLGACVRMNSLMWAGFHRLRRELNSITKPGGPDSAAEDPKRDAEILPFVPRQLRRPDSTS